jgi:hypothetical protein
MSLPFAQAIKEARRALDCGRALYREGLVPECHPWFIQALAILLDGWVPQDGGEPADRDAAALAALERAGYPRVERLRAVLVARPGQSDADVAWGEIERLCRFTAWRLDPPFKRPQVRLLAAVAAGAALVLMAVVAWRLWGRTFATASAAYSSHHAAANAVDGSEATEWLLPDDSLGWLQVNFPSPRSVHHVRLLNAHNVHYQDRGCERVRVTMYCQHRAVASAEGTFVGIVVERSPLDFDLSADCVTYLRVEVLSYFKKGGGLAEVEVD